MLIISAIVVLALLALFQSMGDYANNPQKYANNVHYQPRVVRPQVSRAEKARRRYWYWRRKMGYR